MVGTTDDTTIPLLGAERRRHNLTGSKATSPLARARAVPIHDGTFGCGGRRARSQVILLAVLGIGKWVTETLLQSASQERGFVHDAAMTLAIVVAFAALQQRITKYVTRVFFSGWHNSAESLRDFVDHAAQMTDAEVWFSGSGGCTGQARARASLRRRTGRVMTKRVPDRSGSDAATKDGA